MVQLLLTRFDGKKTLVNSDGWSGVEYFSSLSNVSHKDIGEKDNDEWADNYVVPRTVKVGIEGSRVTYIGGETHTFVESLEEITEVLKIVEKLKKDPEYIDAPVDVAAFQNVKSQQRLSDFRTKAKATFVKEDAERAETRESRMAYERSGFNAKN